MHCIVQFPFCLFRCFLCLFVLLCHCFCLLFMGLAAWIKVNEWMNEWMNKSKSYLLTVTPGCTCFTCPDQLLCGLYLCHTWVYLFHLSWSAAVWLVSVSHLSVHVSPVMISCCVACICVPPECTCFTCPDQLLCGLYLCPTWVYMFHLSWSAAVWLVSVSHLGVPVSPVLISCCVACICVTPGCTCFTCPAQLLYDR